MYYNGNHYENKLQPQILLYTKTFHYRNLFI